MVENEQLTIFSLFYLLGGLALFLFGIKYAAEGLRGMAGNRLKPILSRLTRKRFLGLLIGTVATFATQSSSATTVILVSLANSALIGLKQSLGIILGADIGTTFTVQLIAFKISDYSPLIIFVGFMIMVSGGKENRGKLGQAIMAFGFIFLGMKIMSDVMAPLRSHPGVMATFASVGRMPLLGILISTVFTALIQSSAATIGLVLTLCFQGILDLNSAIPLVLGANIGTCATALLASLGTSTEARRVALAHIIFKILGVALFFPFLRGFESLASRTSGDLARQVANAHTIFNVGMALIFLPLVPLYARMVNSLIRESGEKKEFGPLYLDPRVLETPALALGQATREILRMGDIVYGMLRGVMEVFKKNDEDLRSRIVEDDDKVDLLEESITPYLTKLSQKELTPEQSEREIALLHIVDELEHIGDLVSKNIMIYARKKIEDGFYFSDQGFDEIKSYHRETLITIQMALNASASFDKVCARQIIDRTKKLVDEQNRLHRAHIERLHRGYRESLETSTIHLDLLNDFKGINLHASYIGYSILGRV